VTEKELDAIEARYIAAASTTINLRGPWASLADVPALLIEVRLLRETNRIIESNYLALIESLSGIAAKEAARKIYRPSRGKDANT
jgi:hypothetical protein